MCLPPPHSAAYQGKCEEHLWGEHPQMVHRFFAMAHELEAQACTLPSLLKWQSILVRLPGSCSLKMSPVMVEQMGVNVAM